MSVLPLNPRKPCDSDGCGNPARTGRKLCNSCRSRRYDDPMKVLYWNLKKSAKRRGKHFDIPFEDFAQLARFAGYDVLHGRTADGMSVDRINPRLGYTLDNIQFITVSENSVKRWEDLCPF